MTGFNIVPILPQLSGPCAEKDVRHTDCLKLYRGSYVYTV